MPTSRREQRTGHHDSWPHELTTDDLAVDIRNPTEFVTEAVYRRDAVLHGRPSMPWGKTDRVQDNPTIMLGPSSSPDFISGEPRWTCRSTSPGDTVYPLISITVASTGGH